MKTITLPLDEYDNMLKYIESIKHSKTILISSNNFGPSDYLRILTTDETITKLTHKIEQLSDNIREFEKSSTLLRCKIFNLKHRNLWQRIINKSL